MPQIDKFCLILFWCTIQTQVCVNNRTRFCHRVVNKSRFIILHTVFRAFDCTCAVSQLYAGAVHVSGTNGNRNRCAVRNWTCAERRDDRENPWKSDSRDEWLVRCWHNQPNGGIFSCTRLLYIFVFWISPTRLNHFRLFINNTLSIIV